MKRLDRNMKNKKLRSSAFLNLAHTNKIEPERGNVDLWLQRLSHFSQTGILFATIWMMYFTVIPLYQKSLLDEAIAKKEIEIIEATKSLHSIYIETRPYLAKDFSLNINLNCSPTGQLIAGKKKSDLGDGARPDIFQYEILRCIRISTKNS